MTMDEAVPTLVTGAVVIGADTNNILDLNVFQATATDGDYFELQKILLKAGSYTCRVVGQTTSDRCKLDWALDGVSQTTGQDWYSGSIAYNVVKTFTLTVLTDGVHTLRGTVNGKNASSSGYRFALTKVWAQ